MPFDMQSRALARLQAVANRLQIGGDLARQHFVIAGAEHVRRGAAVGDGLQRDGGAALVHGSARWA